TTARPPPTPTLFPYTTLFRSLVDEPFLDEPERDLEVPRIVDLELRFHAELLHPGGEPAHTVRRVAELAVREAHRARVQRGHSRADRKSTRLNSSHVATSYAVF